MSFHKPLNQIIYLFLFTAVSASCQQNNRHVNSRQSSPSSINKEQLIDSNKRKILEEQERIKGYIDRYNLNMKETSTGLYYHVDKTGNGISAKLLSDVEFDYRVNKLDGTYIYSSDSSGLLKITVGQSDEPSGLQEALLLFNEGTEATIIVPSYLAYGITGDGDKIEGGETLVYRLKIRKVTNN